MQQPWNGKPLVSTTEAFIRGKDTAARLGLFIASHPPEDHHLNVQHAYEISESCADHDRRFLSVHLHAEGGGTPQNWKRWFGKRHLEVCVDERGADEFEEEVWKWLCMSSRFTLDLDVFMPPSYRTPVLLQAHEC